MELPIDFRNFLRVEDSVIFFLGIGLWKEFLDLFGIDRSIDDDMGNMDSQGAEFPRHGLGLGAKTKFDPAEGSEAGGPTHGCGCAGEKNRSPAPRFHIANRLTSGEKSCKTAHLPDFVVDP